MALEKNILIIGSYGASNIGDEAILSVMLQKIRRKVSVLSGNPKDTKRRHKINKVYLHLPFGLRSLLSFKWIKSFQALKKADIVILGGGGLFVDNYSRRAVPLWAWHAFWANLLRKPIVLFAVSIGPLNTKLARFLTLWVLKKAKHITLRDKLSLELIEKNYTHGATPKHKKDHPMGHPTNHPIVGADPSFLHPLPSKKIIRKKRIAINLRPWEFSPKIIESFTKKYSKEYEIIFIATDAIDEKILPNPITPKSFSELLELLLTCEFAVGMRLHFLIAAALAGCKVAGLSYSTKVKAVLKEIDLPYLEIKNLNKEGLEKLFKKAKTADNIQEQKQKAKKLFDFLSKLKI